MRSTYRTPSILSTYIIPRVTLLSPISLMGGTLNNSPLAQGGGAGVLQTGAAPRPCGRPGRGAGGTPWLRLGAQTDPQFHRVRARLSDVITSAAPEGSLGDWALCGQLLLGSPGRLLRLTFHVYKLEGGYRLLGRVAVEVPAQDTHERAGGGGFGESSCTSPPWSAPESAGGQVFSVCPWGAPAVPSGAMTLPTPQVGPLGNLFQGTHRSAVSWTGDIRWRWLWP